MLAETRPALDCQSVRWNCAASYDATHYCRKHFESAGQCSAESEATVACLAFSVVTERGRVGGLGSIYFGLT